MDVNGLEVTITGTSLNPALTSVTIAHTNCAVSSSDDTSISCTMDHPWTVGNWFPEVRDVKGLFPLDPNLQRHSVAIILDSILPNTGLNPAGGDTLVLTGQNFPWNLADNPVEIKASDGSICDVSETSTTSIKCITRQF